MSLEVEVNAKDAPKWDRTTQTFREWRNCFELWLASLPKVAHFYDTHISDDPWDPDAFLGDGVEAKELKKRRGMLSSIWACLIVGIGNNTKSLAGIKKGDGIGAMRQLSVLYSTEPDNLYEKLKSDFDNCKQKPGQKLGYYYVEKFSAWNTLHEYCTKLNDAAKPAYTWRKFCASFGKCMTQNLDTLSLKFSLLTKPQDYDDKKELMKVLRKIDPTIGTPEAFSKPTSIESSEQPRAANASVGNSVSDGKQIVAAIDYLNETVSALSSELKSMRAQDDLSRRNIPPPSHVPQHPQFVPSFPQYVPQYVQPPAFPSYQDASRQPLGIANVSVGNGRGRGGERGGQGRGNGRGRGRGRGLCFNWLNRGSCRFGNQCRFKHATYEEILQIAEQHRQPQQQQQQQTGQQSNTQTEVRQNNNGVGVGNNAANGLQRSGGLGRNGNGSQAQLWGMPTGTNVQNQSNSNRNQPNAQTATLKHTASNMSATRIVSDDVNNDEHERVMHTTTSDKMHAQEFSTSSEKCPKIGSFNFSASSEKCPKIGSFNLSGGVSCSNPNLGSKCVKAMKFAVGVIVMLLMLRGYVEGMFNSTISTMQNLHENIVKRLGANVVLTLLLAILLGIFLFLPSESKLKATALSAALRQTLLDSGASHCFFAVASAFISLTSSSGKVQIASGEVDIKGEGESHWSPESFYVPDFENNLVGVYPVCKHRKAAIVFNDEVAVIVPNSHVKFLSKPQVIAKCINGVYVVPDDSITVMRAMTAKRTYDKLMRLHKRFGHISMRRITNVFATDSKSVTGFLILCFAGLILWKSEKQSIIAFSPNEAEYIALCAAAKGAFFVRQFLLELKVGIPEEVMTFLFGDNKGANQLANYPVTTARNRHIRLQYHTIREYVERKELTVLKIATAKNPADALTKSLDGEKHLALTRFVMEDTPEVEMKGVTPSRF